MAITTYYCDWSDVEARLSTEGASARVDDNPALANNVLLRATVEVNKRLLTMYTAAALAGSDTIKEVCADIAWFFADQRRNNPAAKASKFAYEQAVEYLTSVAKGVFPLPDVAARKGAAPTLSNQRAAQYPVNRVQTVTGTSTGKPEGYVQHNDSQTNPIDYSV